MGCIKPKRPWRPGKWHPLLQGVLLLSIVWELQTEWVQECLEEFTGISWFVNVTSLTAHTKREATAESNNCNSVLYSKKNSVLVCHEMMASSCEDTLMSPTCRTSEGLCVWRENNSLLRSVYFFFLPLGVEYTWSLVIVNEYLWKCFVCLRATHSCSPSLDQVFVFLESFVFFARVSTRQ